jgi:hypothetical protein
LAHLNCREIGKIRKLEENRKIGNYEIVTQKWIISATNFGGCHKFLKERLKYRNGFEAVCLGVLSSSFSWLYPRDKVY